MQRNYDGFRGAFTFGAVLIFAALANLAAAVEQPPPCCVTIGSPDVTNLLVEQTMSSTTGQGSLPYFSYLTVTFPGADPFGKNKQSYAAWCFDTVNGIGVPLRYSGKLYSSCETPFLYSFDKWRVVNYIISKRGVLNLQDWWPCFSTMPRTSDVQWAIWRVLGLPDPAPGDFPAPNETLVQCIKTTAEAAVAAGWNPTLGDKVAVIFNAFQNTDPTKPDIQLIFLEVPCTKVPPVCDLSVKVECAVPATPPAIPFDCSGAKPIDTLWVRWNGAASPVYVKAWNGSVGTGTAQTFGPVVAGEIVKFTRSGTFPNDVYFQIYSDSTYSSLVGTSTFHLSCSDADMNGPEDCQKPAGDGKGTNYLNAWVFEGMGGNGKYFECSPPPPIYSTNCSLTPKPFASCETLGKPTSLTFKYTGGGCAASNNPQSGKFICSSTLNPALPINVVSANGYAIPAGPFNPGDEITVTASSFSSQSLFTITNVGGPGTESLSIHTSCSQPLAVGDVFGSLTLVAFNGQTGGSSVMLRYTVTVGGTYPMTNVSVTDPTISNQPIKTYASLNPGVYSFELPVAITETMTFKPSVKGTVEGLVCDKTGNETKVVVNVNCPTTVSPSVSFACSDVKPINSLKMEWAGTMLPSGEQIGTIWVQAWKGSVGSLALGGPVKVAVGGVLEVSGYAGSPNDVYWELFRDVGGVQGTKFGESTFHVSCSDDDMNGPDDCGKLQGDGKARVGYINAWIFRGMSGNGKVIDCSGSTPLPKATIKDKKLLWTLANNGTTPLTLTRVEATWPTTNGKLMKVKFDGDVVDEPKVLGPSVIIEASAMTTDTKKKSIAPGDTRVFTLEFEKDASSDLGAYKPLVLWFGSCKLEL